MSVGYFSNRWKYNKVYDIFEAIGPLAQRIAEITPDIYIGDFTPIVNNLGCMRSSKASLVVMFYRCGIHVNLSELDNLLFATGILPYLDDLYLALELGTTDALTLPASGKEALCNIILSKLDPKYAELRECGVHILQYMHKLDEYMAVIDQLPEYMRDIMKYLIPKGKTWNVADNHFYLVSLMVASEHHPSFKQILRDVMTQMGIYTLGDATKYVLNAIGTYPDNITRYLTIKAPALWFKFPTKAALINKIWINTDLELIRKSKVILPYTDHNQHLDMFKSFMNNTKLWFVPTSEFMIQKNFTETTMSMEEVKDSYIIGYGTSSNYKLYSTYEISGAIRLEEPIEWQLPGFVTRPTERDVYPLLTILEIIEQTDILTKIRKYFELTTNAGSYNPKEPYLEFFKAIVELGLFARRWKNYDAPFPYTHTDAENKQVNPAIAMTPLIHKCRTIMKQWKDPVRFNMYNRIDEVIGTDFISYAIKVFNNDECIRTASIKFIATGLYYLKTIYKTTYYHPKTLEPLSLDKLQGINLNAPEEH